MTPSDALAPGLSRLGVPVLLMNPPLSLATQVANNPWMEEMSPLERAIRPERAHAQFLRLYRHLSRFALVYLLPSTPGLQDQPYVSNLAVTLPHRTRETVIVSRFRSEPRVGETAVGLRFFALMNFDVHQPPVVFDGEPLYFEGEADLKFIRDELYIGAHGMRTSRNALKWAAERFDIEILPFQVTDLYLYHLDCCVFPMTPDAIILCTSVSDPSELRRIEARCEVIDVSFEQARSGITNCLALGDEVLCDSDIGELRRDSAWYAGEKSKIDALEHICSRFGRTLRVFSMSEFYKSGALLSCLVMHIVRGEQTAAVTCRKTS